MGEKVVVFGSYVQEYISRQQGLPVPGQTLVGSEFLLGRGGKGGNQAVAAHRAGADITYITKVGRDAAGEGGKAFFEEQGIDTSYFLQADHVSTGSALVMVDEATAQNQIVMVPGACSAFTDADVERVKPLLESCAYLLVQQEVNLDIQNKVIGIVHRAGGKVILNPAPAQPIADEVMAMLTCITPNETEVQTLTGIAVNDQQSAEQAAQALLRRGVKNVVITMGSMGAFATDGVRSELISRFSVEAVDTTGAGDAFNGSFVTALSEGADLFEALRFANAGGALSVTKIGSAVGMPYRAEIDALIKSAGH